MKKMLLIYLAVSMLLCLVACGTQPAASSSASTPGAASSSSAPSSTAEPVPTTKTVALKGSQLTETLYSRMLQEYSYDTCGRLLRFQYTQDLLQHNSTTVLSLDYTYNPDGIIQQILLSTRGETVALEASYENGKLVSYLGEVDGERSGWYYAYDAAGLVSSISILEDGKEREVISMTYHPNGQLQQRTLYDIATQQQETYDTQGHLTERTVYMLPNLELLTRDTFAYNEAGQLIRQATYVSAGNEVSQVQEYAYDAQGRICRFKLQQANVNLVDLEGVWDSENSNMHFSFELEQEAAEIIYHYDSTGRNVGVTMLRSGEILSKSLSSYTYTQLPADYEELRLSDPAYMLFAFGVF